MKPGIKGHTWLILLSIAFFPSMVTAQIAGEAVKIIEIDSITRNAKEVIPLDVPFVLKVQSRNYYIRGIMNRELPMLGIVQNVQILQVVARNGSIQYLSSAALRAQYTYNLYLQRRANADEWVRISRTNALLFTNSMDSTTFATIPQYGTNLQVATRSTFNAYRNFFVSSLAPIYTRANTFINPSISYTLTSFDNLASSQDMRQVLNSAVADEVATLHQPIQKLVDLVQTDRDSIILGLLQLNTSYYQTNAPNAPPPISVSVDHLPHRIQNLASTGRTLKSIYNYVELINDRQPSNVYSSLLNDLNTAINIFSANQRDLEAVVNQVNQSPLFFVDEYYSSSQRTFNTSVGTVVQADVGVAVIFTNKDYRVGTYIRPYFGVNINFRPVNKNVPFYSIQGIGKHFSLMAGITVGSLNRGEEPTMDLFGSNNLLAGLGIRLNHAVRFNTGTILFNAKHPDPLVDKPKRKFGVFYGISIDMEIRNLLSSIAGLLNI